MKRLLVAALFLLFAGSTAAAQHGAVKTTVAVRAGSQTVESLQVHLRLSSMSFARPPEALEGQLLLSAAGPYRFVGAVFEHESFATIHPFEKNRQGVFVLAYPIPLKRNSPLTYRLVIDGVWTIDPANPRRIHDPITRLELSIAEVPYLSDLHLGLYPILGEDGKTASFLFRAESGEVVTVCGDFDNWDPFIHELSETSPGLYRLDLPLPPGIHYYTYIYRGEALPDPLNPSKASSPEGKTVSVLVIAD